MVDLLVVEVLVGVDLVEVVDALVVNFWPMFAFLNELAVKVAQALLTDLVAQLALEV